MRFIRERVPERLHAVLICLVLPFALPFALSVQAAAPNPNEAAYTNECASCHIAYPPRLMDSGSWNVMLDGLNSHFGVDASTDPQTLSRIRSHLQRNSSQSSRRVPQDNSLRITQTPWFLKEHRKVRMKDWLGQFTKSGKPGEAGNRKWSNCEQCHAGAAKGFFDDDD